MNEIVEFFDHPPLHDPVLILGLMGWIDAGAGANAATSALLAIAEADPIANFDIDELLDFRARRPLLQIDNGRLASIRWPGIQLRALTDNNGRHALLLHGAEPDRAWPGFVAAVMDMAAEMNVRMVVGLGAYPAPVPHTRPVRLSLTSPSAELLDQYPDFQRGTIEVPAGIQPAIEMDAHESGIRAAGLWAQVPHYLSAMSYPLAGVALLEGLHQVAGLEFDPGQLSFDVLTTRAQIDELVSNEPSHHVMIEQLEELYDSTAALDNSGALPTGDELANELEEFLRSQDEDN
jgi:predicted ATP-grasp superfamily ATP-dependent carboligase